MTLEILQVTDVCVCVCVCRRNTPRSRTQIDWFIFRLFSCSAQLYTVEAAALMYSTVYPISAEAALV